MSTDRDTKRIVRSWLDEGVTVLPDRVLDAVLDQLPATPQRRFTWWPARRFPEMNTFAKFGVAAAAAVLAAVVGFSIITGGGTGIGGPSQPTPTSTPAPTASSPEPSPLEGLLPEGRHVLSHDADGVPMTVTLPATDWYGERGGGVLVKHSRPNAPDGAGMIVFPGDDLYVYADPCQWSTTRPDAPATTVDEVVTALAAQASRDASAPVDVTVDGYAGKSITLHVPDDAMFSECDLGTFGSWAVGPDSTPSRYHQDPGQIDKLWIVDVDGELVVIDIGYYAGTPQAVVDEMESIVESTTFE